MLTAVLGQVAIFLIWEGANFIIMVSIMTISIIFFRILSGWVCVGRWGGEVGEGGEGAGGGRAAWVWPSLSLAYGQPKHHYLGL